MLERPPTPPDRPLSRSPSAIRKRRQRQRLADGKVKFRIYANPDDMRVALHGVGVLPPGEHPHRTVELAYEDQTTDWLLGWRDIL